MAAARSVSLLAGLLLVAGAQAALNTDRTLTTAGAQCLDRFNALVKAQYKGDAACVDLIRAAMSTADPAKCPPGSDKADGPVRKCMGKSKDVAEAWVDFIKTCEVMNVANRAGEAEAASTRKPSCFPSFGSVGDFETWVEGKAATSDARVARGAWLLVAAAAAGAAVVAL